MRLQGCLIDADPPTSATTAAGTLAVWSKGTLIEIMPNHLLRTCPRRSSGLTKTFPPPAPRRHSTTSPLITIILQKTFLAERIVVPAPAPSSASPVRSPPPGCARRGPPVS
jgi:hypothetical protein